MLSLIRILLCVIHNGYGLLHAATGIGHSGRLQNSNRNRARNYRLDRERPPCPGYANGKTNKKHFKKREAKAKLEIDSKINEIRILNHVILVVGDMRVGKSTMLNQMQNDQEIVAGEYIESTRIEPFEREIVFDGRLQINFEFDVLPGNGQLPPDRENDGLLILYSEAGNRRSVERYIEEFGYDHPVGVILSRQLPQAEVETDRANWTQNGHQFANIHWNFTTNHVRRLMNRLLLAMFPPPNQ